MVYDVLDVKGRSLLLACVCPLVMLFAALLKTSAAIPLGYPYIVVTNSGEVSPGNLIGTLGGGSSDSSITYYVILDNTGTNLLYANATNVLLRYVTPQGFATDSPFGFRFKDENLGVVDQFTVIGYGPDSHDVKLLPNGHALLLGQENRLVDMSRFLPGGRVDATATGSIIQEVDAQKRVVFEWHSLDHIALTNSFIDLTSQSLDYTHVNAVTIDPTDNNLLTSFRHTSEIVKINRGNGEVMWRLGGKMNQFTFLNEHKENAPFYTLGQHDVHRLASGNLLYFDNGYIPFPSTGLSRSYSRVVEYALDEVYMTATLVWEYRHVPDIRADCQGSVKRMANGNTLIDWGCAAGLNAGTVVTEVNRAGQLVFEMARRATNGANSTGLRSSLTKQLWNSPDLVRSTIHQDIREGQTYESPQTGVSVTVNRLGGQSNASLVVQRHVDSVRFPTFSGDAPQVVMEHLVLSGSNILTWEAVLNLSAPDTSYVFDTPMIHELAQLRVYQRSTPGQGEFSPLPTTYDVGTQKLRVTTTQLGEFIFAYPNDAVTPYPPVIMSPVDQGEVNQLQPVTLVWIPKGLVSSFDLELSTEPGFGNLALSTNGLGSGRLTVENLLPNTQYFWRVRTLNQGGTSDWSLGSFATAPPRVRVTYPAGGEVWQLFQVVTLRWTANFNSSLAMDLYKGGVSNGIVAPFVANSGAYNWTVGQFTNIAPGADYTIKIRSISDPAVFGFSEPFSIGLVPVTFETRPSGLTLTVDGNNHTSPATFAWVPNSAHTLGTASPQVTAEGHLRYLFDSWSDGGGQTHFITASLVGATNTARFTTNYQLSVTTTPPNAATVLATPPGPWYAPGQTVSLIAQPETPYLIYAWEGVDTQMGDAAQLTMDSYHAVEAKFIPKTGLPLIQTDSLTTVADGRLQFAFTAGAGLATEATVWGATSLTPPNWRLMAKVVLSNGRGVFVEPTAPTEAVRFYRVTLP